ncbi:Nicotinate dehydrogenase FAD-subunit [subsurface metagenome]
MSDILKRDAMPGAKAANRVSRLQELGQKDRSLQYSAESVRGRQVKVFRPRSMIGLLRLYAGNPDALIYAGGTEIIPRAARGKDRRLKLPERVIYLGNVAELFRISRSQRYLDIGACLPLSRILGIGRNIIPRVLYEALSSIGNPAVRNLATLGGNICSPRNDSLTALNVIEARLELRSLAGARWVTVSQFFLHQAGNILDRGEILARIRIPLEDWDYHVFRKVGSFLSPALISFAGTVRLGKGIIELFRFSIGGAGESLFRSRELEARLEGRGLPVPAREIEGLLSNLTGRLGPADNAAALYRRETALRLLRSFLDNINQNG